MKILISIIIPTYNYGAFIERALMSVLPQLSQDVELIVVNDGSTDNTAEVIDRLLQYYPQKFTYITKPNSGAAAARNLGIRSAKGEFILFLDADDEFEANALSLYRRHLSEHPASTMVLAGHYSVYPNGKIKKASPPTLPKTAVARVKAYLLDRTLSIVAGAAIFHRDIFEKAMFTENLGNHEDVKLFATSLALCRISTLDEMVVRVYKHHDSLRHNIHYSVAANNLLPDIVFESLPASMQNLKRHYLASIDLSLSRHLYFEKDYAEAWNSYKSALRKNPLLILKLSYTRKALKAWMKK